MISKSTFAFITVLLFVYTHAGNSYSKIADVVVSNDEVSIKSQQNLAEFLLAHLGQNSGDISQDIKEYISNNKISVMNAVDEISLLFVENK